MKTAVVILNWNTAGQLREFLPSVVASCRTERDTAVIVADNGSTDGSAFLVRDEFPGVGVMSFDTNYGFTGGYNKALSGLDAEYYVLLNSDIETPEGWLSPLVRWMDSHPECAACGPRLLSLRERDHFEYAGAAGGWIDRFGYPYCRGRVLSRTEKDEGQYDGDPVEVAWVSGACLLVRRTVWEKLGGLDDRFFAHMEEIDFCWRARLLGYTVCMVPSSAVYHLGGGTLDATSPQKLKLNFRNNLLLLDNNLALTVGPFKAWWRIAFRRLLDLGSALVYLLQGQREFASAVLQGHREYRRMRGAGRTEGAVRFEDPMMKLCILPLAAIKGEGIFKYLRAYEDSHCRRG